MFDWWVIFLTGLTTGGLTCLAIQGGLLTTALMKQVPVMSAPAGASSSKQDTYIGIQLSKTIWPLVYFLAAKLFAYTVLGFLLGALGSAVQITPTFQAAMQIAVGLFMLATALNMLNVHPIFRYVVIQPPKALTRLVRAQAKSQEAFAPIVLGLMTVFIPCATTQAMEILAISSRSPLLGASILYLFVLGTTPTFLVLGFLATRLRGKLQSVLTLAAACLIAFLGFFSVNAGLNLTGSPLAPSRILASLFQFNTPIQASIVDGVQEITITAFDTSYSPDYINAQKDYPIRLRIVTNNNRGCTRLFTVPEFGISEILPETGETVISLPQVQPGNLYFTCGMGMYYGLIQIT